MKKSKKNEFFKYFNKQKLFKEEFTKLWNKDKYNFPITFYFIINIITERKQMLNKFK